MLDRRGFLLGALATPAIVKFDSLMPVRLMEWPIPNWCPPGWLPCDGRPLPGYKYRTLRSLLGNVYGGGVPDLRASAPFLNNTDYFTSLEYQEIYIIRAEEVKIEAGTICAPVGSLHALIRRYDA